MEFWKDIPGWEGRYQASSEGNIRGLDRVVGAANNKTKKIKGRVLRPSLDSKNYKRVCLSNCDSARRIITTCLVSNLVALAFLGPRPENFEVCHNDGNPNNDKIENLRYDSRANNNKDKLVHGTALLENKNHKTKLSNAEVIEIIYLYKTGSKQKDLSVRFGVCQAYISRLVNRKERIYVYG